jgi:putative transcriptional regulator
MDGERSCGDRLLRASTVLLYKYHMGRKAAEQPIHNRLAVLRAERSLSRLELAEAIGVNFQTIGYLERGDYSPSLDLAFRLAEYFDLPIEAIFARERFAPLSRQTLVREER